MEETNLKKVASSLSLASRSIKGRMNKHKIFKPCFGFFLQGSVKETAIANCLVALASMIIFAVSIGVYMPKFCSTPKWNQYGRPVFWICYYIYWCSEIYFSLLLYTASSHRDLKLCKKWLKYQKTFYMMWLMLFIGHSFGLSGFVEVTQSVLCLTAIYKLYTFWTVSSFINEVKNLGRFNDPLAKLTDADVEEFLEGIGSNDETIHRKSESRCAESAPYDKTFELEMTRFNAKCDWVRIGKGEFGIVYKSKMFKNPHQHQQQLPLPWCGGPGPGQSRSSSPSAYRTVAVKMVDHLITDATDFKTLLAELKIRICIGQHENIVQLIGACTANIRERKLKLVLEYCSLGDVESFLLRNKNTFINQLDYLNHPAFLPAPPPASAPAANNSFLSSHFSEPITTTDLFLWSIQIAKGMAYLHNIKVIHGDLAARNVLLSGDKIAKINDFGMSSRISSYHSYFKSKQKKLPRFWMAPESFGIFHKFSLESDIWSFGVTLWELFSLAQEPYYAFQALPRPTFMPCKVYDVMLNCNEVDPEKRCSFVHIISKLNAELNNFQIKLKHDHLVESAAASASASGPGRGNVRGSVHQMRESYQILPRADHNFNLRPFTHSPYY